MDVDRALVAEATAGSREAFDELVGRYRVRIYTLVRIQTRGDADAEDLVQEIFVRAFRAIGRFRGDSAFRTWLYRIAVNVIKSHAARRGRTAAIVPTTDDGEGTTLERVPSPGNVEEDVARRELIDRALATLPEDMRVVILLRDVQGLDYREIADVTGLPLGTVESRLFRARQRLRPLLEPLIGR